MTYIIAEIGNNHEGSPEQAIKLVRSALECGVDAVKLQLFRAETLVDKSMPSLVPTHKTQYERMKALELPRETFVEAAQICRDSGKDFIVSCFDVNAVEWVAPLVDKFKIASGDMMYEPILDAVFRTEKDVIVSTGMHNVDQIDWLVEKYTPWALLHCVSLYPTPDEKADLTFIYRMMEYWANYKIGYSDHTRGITACLGAIAIGAEVIEKHYTLDHGLSQGDHIHSADYIQMNHLIKEARRLDIMCNSETDTYDEFAMRKYLVRGDNGLRGTYK